MRRRQVGGGCDLAAVEDRRRRNAGGVRPRAAPARGPRRTPGAIPGGPIIAVGGRTGAIFTQFDKRAAPEAL